MCDISVLLLYLTKVVDMLRRHEQWILMMRAQLSRGSAARIDEWVVADMTPYYWREEASSIPEWFIRTCRGLGLTANHRIEDGSFTVTLQ